MRVEYFKNQKNALLDKWLLLPIPSVDLSIDNWCNWKETNIVFDSNGNIKETK